MVLISSTMNPLTSMESILGNLVAQALPQEIPHVYKDLVAVINADKANDENSSSAASLKKQLAKVIEDYNENNFVSVSWEQNGKTEHSIVSKHNKLGSRYIDYTKGKTFQVNHLTLKGSDVGDYEYTDKSVDMETIRKLSNGLQKHAEAITSDLNLLNFAVFPSAEMFKDDPETEVSEQGTKPISSYVLVITITKNNEPNYWNGVWKAVYTYTEAVEPTVEGQVQCDVHYFEEGNVKYNHTETLPAKAVSSDSDTKNILQALDVISEFEASLDDNIIKSFLDMNETGFKNLRRLLPVTRSKVNWGKSIGNYKLGKDASSSEL
ncbi:hypothetical protein ACO0QE_002033 [Hanseniaspora vineae]